MLAALRPQAAVLHKEHNEGCHCGACSSRLADAHASAGSSSSSAHRHADRTERKTPAEREDERRLGFAAAYQQRISALSSLLWSTAWGSRNNVQHHTDHDQQQEQQQQGPEPQQDRPDSHGGILSYGLRHLATLPNLILMPTLGVSPSSWATARSDHSRTSSSERSTSPDSLSISPQRTDDSHDSQQSKGRRRSSASKPTSPRINELRQDAQSLPQRIAHGHTDQGAFPVSGAANERSMPQTIREETSAMRMRLSSGRSESDSSVTRLRVFVPTTRGGRGVMTPLEADADISAYVSGLGLPVDPDVELSSLVRLQSFRLDARKSSHRGHSVSRERADDDSSEVLLRRNHHQQPHRRTNSDGQLAPFADLRRSLSRSLESDTSARSREEKVILPARTRRLLESGKRVSKAARAPVAESRPREDRGRRLSGLSRSPVCSRPAVQAPVSGNFSAYAPSSSEEEEEDGGKSARNSDAEDDTESLSSDASLEEGHRGGGRSRGRSGNARSKRVGSNRRSISPESQKQCAIGLFSSSTSPKRTGSLRGRRNVIATGEKEMTSPLRSVQIPRIRSSPNLSSQGDDDHNADARSSIDGRRRGRADAAKFVSASYRKDMQGNDLQSALSNDSEATVEIVSHGTEEAPMSTAAIDPEALIRQTSVSSLTSGEADASAVARLPLVGAGSLPFAGRPSMVSNGAHLLMLSLELEMMRNRKITGSLKPRWLKARMRTEPHGPAAIVAMMSGKGSHVLNSKDESQRKSPLNNGHLHRTSHEHRVRMGLHSAHHTNLHHQHQHHHHPHHHQHAPHRHHHHQQHVEDQSNDTQGLVRPQAGSSLRYELLPTS